MAAAGLQHARGPLVSMLRGSAARRPRAPSGRHSCARRLAVAASSVGTGEQQRRLYVLDMMPFVFRALPAGEHHQHQQPASGDASPTQHFMAALFKLLTRKQEPPTHMAVVVDVPAPSFRQLKYPQYKAHRPPSPPQLRAEVARMLWLVEAMGVPVLLVPGVEADDVVGSLAARAAGDGFEVVLVSTDKDFYQLLRPGVSILQHPYAESLFGAAEFAQQFPGLPGPAAWRDVKALAGDSSDNIPGVRSVGNKTALELVARFGSVEGALEAFARADGGAVEGVKVRKPQAEALRSREGAAAARLAKQLVTIVTDLKAPPVRQPWPAFELRVPADGGELAVQRAVDLHLPWTAAQLQKLYGEWNRRGGSAAGQATAGAAAAAAAAATAHPAV